MALPLTLTFLNISSLLMPRIVRALMMATAAKASLISTRSMSLSVRSFCSRTFLIDSPGTVAMSLVCWETSA
ncbi:MAG: hypothetical protein A4E67_00980 [Syntrophaceae bacterium PtaB.Bin038]|nr:MAG: hypothetical protein A4E67_00980 [Syntrophaceae bacterium PtaB.Bin038]